MLDVITQILRGKSLIRAMFNYKIRNIEINGTVIDMGSGNKRPSYYNYMKFKSNSRIFTVNVVRNNMPDIVADLEWKFPFKDECADAIIAFNLMEHIYNFNNFTRECCRVLRSNGMLYIFVPFLVRFHPDPEDYYRFTSQALSKILTSAGFEIECLEEVGRGPFTAACSQIDGLLSVNIFARMAFATLAIAATAGDTIIGIISTPEKQLRSYPLGYIAVCRKSL